MLRNQQRKQVIRERHLKPLDEELSAVQRHRSDAESSDTSERIARALASLPERYEAVLRAKYLDQQSVDQIATVWNETSKAIESLLTRARRAFREVYLKLKD